MDEPGSTVLGPVRSNLHRDDKLQVEIELVNCTEMEIAEVMNIEIEVIVGMTCRLLLAKRNPAFVQEGVVDELDILGLVLNTRSNNPAWGLVGMARVFLRVGYNIAAVVDVDEERDKTRRKSLV